MKGLYTSAGLLFLVLLISACTVGNQANTARNVSLIHYFTGDLSAGIAELAMAVNNENKSFVLTPTPLEHESYKSIIRVQLEGPNPPDLFSFWAGARTRNLVERREVQSLTSLFENKIPVDAFPDSIRKALSYNDEMYMVPLTRHYVGFFYNTKIFKAAGLTEPKSWDELRLVVKVLRDRGIQAIALGANQRWPAQFYFDYLLLRTAGFDYRQRLMEGKAHYTDSAVRAAFQYWRDLAQLGAFNADAANLDWTDAAMRVAEGKAGMTLMGTWLIGAFNGRNFQYPTDYGFFPFPQVGGYSDDSALGPIDGILLAAKARHSQDALVVLENLAKAEPQLSFNIAAGGIAPRNGIDPERYLPIQGLIGKIIDRSRHWAFNFDLATPPEQAEIGLTAIHDFVRQPQDLDRILVKWESEVQRSASK